MSDSTSRPSDSASPLIANQATSRVPAHPSLEQLRKQAKELLRAFRANDPIAARRFITHKPELANKLDAALQIARWSF